jgi:hypothetical protein
MSAASSRRCSGIRRHSPASRTPDLNNYLTDWDYFDGASDRIAEVYSRHGHYETGVHGLQQALAAGYRFGFVAVSDSRTGQPGDYGLTAILATSLGKSSLHAAMKARRTYATSGARIGLTAYMDDHPMGEEYVSSTGPTLSVTCTPTATLRYIEVVKNNSVVYTYVPPGGSPPKPESTGWRRGPDTDIDARWTELLYDDTAWKATALQAELDAPRKAGPGAAVRLRESLLLDAVPPTAILRTNLSGEYRIWVNGGLLVDTHRFQYDDPNTPHDCNAPDAHELAGSPEYFRKLGFYDLGKLGARLRAGRNVIALEYEPSGPQAAAPAVELLPMPAASPVSLRGPMAPSRAPPSITCA